MKNLIVQYVNYNYWANCRIAKVLLSIDFSLLDKELTNSFPSIRKTVHHIWDAELVWMARIQDENLQWPPSAQFQNPSIDHFLKTSQQFINLIEKQEDTYFSSQISYIDSKGNSYVNTKGDVIMHCMNHSTFHRGQIITLLREVGITQLPSTDLITYLRELKK